MLRNSAQLCIDFHIKSVKLSRDKIEFYFTKLLLQHCVIVFAPFREQKVIQKPMQNDLTNYFPNKRRAAKTLFQKLDYMKREDVQKGLHFSNIL